MPSALLLVILVIVALYLVAGVFRYLRQMFQGGGRKGRSGRPRGSRR